MAMVCTNMTEWIETEVSKPVEEWVESTEKKCKKRKWYDPRRWLCWLVTTLVKIIRWVVVTIVTAVVTLVCHLIADVLGIIIDLLQFLWLLLKALFTWDKCTLQEALAELGNVVGDVVEIIGDVIIRPIIDRIQTARLRRYVKHEIAQRYWQQPDVIPQLNELFNVDHGVFGYRVTCTLHRMYVDSQTRTPRYADVPNLFGLHRDGLINLYELAGFDRDCSITTKTGWYRPRPQTATFPFAAGGGGFGEPTPPELKRERLDEYINSAGAEGPHFRIYAISPGNLDKRVDAAQIKGRQIGLILDFDRHDLEVTDERFINYSTGIQTTFLIQGLGRRDENADPGGARLDLCTPVATAVFGFDNKIRRGLTNNLIGTDWCIPGRNLTDSNTSGVTFIDDIPDEMRKYVLIHELGHYYGLCHVDGFDRIMVSGEKSQGSLWTWKAIPNTLIHGGPRFIYVEAQRAWDFIIANFPLSCFISRGPILR